MADNCGSGLGLWSGYETGRQDERAHRAGMDMAANIAARLRGQVPVNANALIAENQALRQHNQALQHHIQQLEASNRISSEDWERMREWGLGLRDRLQRLLAEQEEQKRLLDQELL